MTDPNRVSVCEADGCGLAGHPCYAGMGAPGPADCWLCPLHGEEQGYCPVCGCFALGTDCFDFRGLCLGCWEQAEADAEGLIDDLDLAEYEAALDELWDDDFGG